MSTVRMDVDRGVADFSTTPTATLARTERTRGPRWRGSLVRGVLGIVGLLVLLEVAPLVGLVDSRYLPPFHDMLFAGVARVQTGAFWIALGQTMTTWLVGLLIAVVGAVILGILIGSSSFVRNATASTIEFLRPIPSVAFVPLAVLLYGTGMGSTLLLVVYGSFWPMLVQVIQGMRDVDPVVRDTARSFRFRPVTVVRTVLWPSALPYAVTGFRLSASIAIILTVTGELIIGTPGIGNLVATAQGSGAWASMYALVIITGLVGLTVNLLVRLLERRALHWHVSVRQGNH